MIGAFGAARTLRIALLCFCALSGTSAAAAEIARHGLTIDDVLDTISIEHATISPDGEWVAAVVQRPARAGEVFGRTAYEVDPSRNDVWLVSIRTGERRNLTQGQAQAAGFWCAAWSPDGRRLAMLSTRPEDGEPRGGNDVHLYLWDRDTGALTRAAGHAMMTQTRYGAALNRLDLRGGARGGAAPHACRAGEENAPFAWLDDERLLMVTLPAGQVSALIDEYDRPFEQAASTRRALRDGAVPTVTAMGSGAEGMPDDVDRPRAVIRVLDVGTGASRTLGEVPAYPFHGTLTLSVSPDGRKLAVLAPRGAIPPGRGLRLPRLDGDWRVEKQLGFLDLAGTAPAQWVRLPAPARYPLELAAWAPDSRTVAFLARARFEEETLASFAAGIDGGIAAAADAHAIPEAPSAGEPAVPLPPDTEILERRPEAVLWRESTRTGLYLRYTALPDGRMTELLAVNTHRAEIDWGETRSIDYVGASGEPLRAAVLLPTGYRAGTRYPVLAWVYPGHVADGADDSWFDPDLPGLYNLRLYAARGYVVLVPSLPAHRIAEDNDPARDLAGNVLPAIDRLVGLGIADPARIGVMGHSFGGHSVYSLVTQTDRFRAAVALSGLTDLAQAHGQFDPTARGYPGIEHEKSANWAIFEAGRGLGEPYEDRARYWRNSPIANVDRVETPLLLVHGELDVRGAPAQAETFFNALYRQGKTARLLRYWGESHSLAQSPANIRDIVEEILDWFDRYLGTPGASSPTVRQNVVD